MAYISSIERTGIEKGLRQGKEILLLRLLTCKFGEISKYYQERTHQADAEMLLIWGKDLLEAQTLDEVFKS